MSDEDTKRRLDDLEKRVAALEGSAQPKRDLPPARICPISSSEMRVTKERPHDTFDFAGLKIHEMACTKCGHKTERNFNPAKGYE